MMISLRRLTHPNQINFPRRELFIWCTVLFYFTFGVPSRFTLHLVYCPVLPYIWCTVQFYLTFGVLSCFTLHLVYCPVLPYIWCTIPFYLTFGVLSRFTLHLVYRPVLPYICVLYCTACSSRLSVYIQGVPKNMGIQ